MQCPFCGFNGIQLGYKSCPRCGKSISSQQSYDNNSRKQSDFVASSFQKTVGSTENYPKQASFSSRYDSQSLNDVEMIKNKVVWSVAPGEIARRIDPKTFLTLSKASGVYIQEGVTAVLMIDGEIVTEMSSGTYYFAGVVERFAESVRAIWRFFTGHRKEENELSHDERRNKVSIALQNLRGNSIVDVILKADKSIPILFGIEDQNGRVEFAPYKVSSGLNEVKIGLSMYLNITDFKTFRINYLTDKNSLMVSDIQHILHPYIYEEIKKCLAGRELTTDILPNDVEFSLRWELKNCVDRHLKGIAVEQILSITTQNDDFERFREVERKLYLSDKELDFLIRSNDFKNRLQLEENNQQLRDVKTAEELRYALAKLNNDELLHKDEIEEFVKLLEAKKKIRNANTDAEVDKALADIENDKEKSRLIRDDDLEAMRNAIKRNKNVRDELDIIWELQSTQRIAHEKIACEKLVDLDKIKTEQELGQAKIKAQQELGQAEIKADQELQQTAIKAEEELNRAKQGLNQSEHDLTKQSLENESDIYATAKDTEQSKFNADQQSQAHKESLEDQALKHQVNVSDLFRGEREKEDTYGDVRRGKLHQFDVNEARDDISLGKEMDNAKLDVIERGNEIELSAAEKAAEISRRNLEIMSNIKVKEKAQDLEHEQNMAEMKAENEQIQLEAMSKMSSEAIIATKIANLSGEAQKAFAETLSSARELEFANKSYEEREKMMRELIEKGDSYAQGSMQQQKEMMDKFMEMMKDAMHTNAGVVRDAVAGQQNNAVAMQEAMKSIYSKRVDELEHDKNEAKSDKYHAEQRLDTTQDQALHYTTRVSESDKGGGNGLNVNISKIFDELKASGILVNCPNCGKPGLRGRICSCGKQL